MHMLSLREKARLLDEFNSLRLFILDAVSVYITVNNYDLIISNRVVISRNTGLFGRNMSHMQLVMMIIVYGSVAFVGFFGVFGEQGERSPCSPKSLRGYCKKTVKNL